MGEDLKPLQHVKTLQGQMLQIAKDGATVTVQNASVIKANVQATNGVVHVIDGVLMPPSKNIVELASGDTDLSTLVTALKAGKLTTALSGTGPFTVFAPTNDAFAALPKATLAFLLKPANIKDLDSILEYHVINGSALYAEDLKPLQHVKTLQGQMLQIAKDGATVTVQNASVIKANVLATNGVVHIIDGVLTPPSKNIVELAAGIPDLSTLVTALKAGKLVTALSGAGPFTVFAPTNEAFAALPKARLASLLDPANIKQLDAVLEYHVISGTAVRAEDLNASQYVTTLEGQEPLHITKVDGIVVVGNAKVTMADVAATNGVVHVINAVLMEGDSCHGIYLPKESTYSIFGRGPVCLSRSGACTAFGYKPLHCLEVGFTVCCAGDQSYFNYSTIQRFQKTGTKCVAPANLPCYMSGIEVFQSIDDLSTLSSLFDNDTPTDVTQLGLFLKGAGPFTFFAPANNAFTALPKATLASLLEPANIKKLDSILRYHVISGAAVYAEDLKTSQDVKTLEGQKLHITKVGASVTVQNAKVTIADVASTNGVVHIIDSLLMPPKAVTELTELA